MTCCLFTLVACSLGCGQDRASRTARAPDTAPALDGSRVIESRDTTTHLTPAGDSGAVGSAGAAVAVIRDYFAAIDAHDYRRAYGAWERGGNASGQNLAAFRAGFAGTTSVRIQLGMPGRIEGAAGSRYVDVPVRVTTQAADGGIRHVQRRYVLRRAVVPGASPEQRRWHIYSSTLDTVK